MKIAINTDIGGFDLSEKAILRLYELGFKDFVRRPATKLDRRHVAESGIWKQIIIGDDIIRFPYEQIYRSNPLLIQVVEEMGEEADGEYGTVKIINIPDDMDWILFNHEDGSESVRENHRVWCGEEDDGQYAQQKWLNNVNSPLASS